MAFLSQLYAKHNKMTTNRQTFIDAFIKRIKEYKYVLLKHTTSPIHNYSLFSDLDFLVEEGDLQTLGKFIKEAKNAINFKVVKKSFAHYYHIYFADGSFLQIDLICQLKIKDYHYLNAEEILAERVRNREGLYVPCIEHYAEHVLLFNLLNGSSVANKYNFFFKTQDAATVKVAYHYLKLKYKFDGKDLFDIFLFNKKNRAKALQVVKQLALNKGIARLRSKAQYLVDTVKGFASNRGETITFSGVDGAGKSTIIQNFKQTLERKYRRRVKVLRHRPSLLPILSAYKYGKKGAEQRAASNLPRQGENTSKIKSFIRLSYYLIDYAIGQFYVFAKYNLRGIDVLYDRYYYDFMADPKRSNLVMDYQTSKWLSKVVFMPRLNFFLYASPETILARKQELSANDILNLTASYNKVFDEFGQQYPNKKYCKIENVQLEQTMDVICKTYAKAA